MPSSNVIRETARARAQKIADCCDVGDGCWGEGRRLSENTVYAIMQRENQFVFIARHRPVVVRVFRAAVVVEYSAACSTSSIIIIIIFGVCGVHTVCTWDGVWCARECVSVCVCRRSYSLSKGRTHSLV